MRFKAWLELSADFRGAAEGISPWEPTSRDVLSVLVEDIEADTTLGELRPALATEGVRALAYVPLISDDRLVGQFVVYYAAVHAFTDAEVLQAQTIAAQVAFAIEQHRAQDVSAQPRFGFAARLRIEPPPAQGAQRRRLLFVERRL